VQNLKFASSRLPHCVQKFINRPPLPSPETREKHLARAAIEGADGCDG
jgi:hypothetical protein